MKIIKAARVYRESNTLNIWMGPILYCIISDLRDPYFLSKCNECLAGELFKDVSLR